MYKCDVQCKILLMERREMPLLTDIGKRVTQQIIRGNKSFVARHHPWRHLIRSAPSETADHPWLDIACGGNYPWLDIACGGNHPWLDIACGGNHPWLAIACGGNHPWLDIACGGITSLAHHPLLIIYRRSLTVDH